MATAKTTKTTTKAKRPSVTKSTNSKIKAADVTPLGTTPQSDLSKQIDVLRADLKTLAQTVKTQAMAKVDGRTETAKQVASEQADLAKARYDELTTKAEVQIREKPLSSMAIAVGAGVLLGAILRS